MNASLKSVPSTSARTSGQGSPRLAPVPGVVAIEGVLEMPGEMSLYHGGKLSDVKIAWRMVGPENAPVVCALGGISANRRVCTTDDPKSSWWGQVAGVGCALDSDRFRVLSFDYLGGSAESTGPVDGVEFLEHFQLRPGRRAARGAGSSQHQIPARDRQRLVRRHGRAGFR